MAMKKKEQEFMVELKRHMGVLVEGLRSEIRVVVEQYGGIVNRMDNAENHIEGVVTMLDRIGFKLAEHDKRFDMVDMRLGTIEIDLKGVKTALFDVSHRLNRHEKSEFST